MPSLEVVRVGASDAELVEAARSLFEEYAASLGFDLAFQGFEREMARFPAGYVRPAGSLRLALVGGQRAGCVAMRRFDEGTCEMKRLFTRTAFRGLGVGRALVRTIIGDARCAGYARMRLDTVPGMEVAAGLYAACGFVEAAPYRDNPIPGARFLELGLDGDSGNRNS